jgi:Photosynthetic reaction centre, H-chain N-terminal region
MYNQYFAGTIDITEMVLYLFFAFFACLVFYLQKEGEREGFPLEHDVTGELESRQGLFFPAFATITICRFDAPQPGLAHRLNPLAIL